MDFKTIKTIKGGKVCIHDGATLTTNVWYEWGWFEITDLVAKDKLRELAKNESIDLFNELRNIYKDPNKIGTPYRRNRNNTKKETVADNETTKEETTTTLNEKEEMEKKVNVVKGLIMFFNEFNFNPANRFINQLLQNNSSKEKMKNYVSNYMALCDNPFKQDIEEKMKSCEFDQILTDLQTFKPTTKVNNRFEVYYGPQGTGKTTYVVSQYPNAKITTCNETMDSDILMQTFDFDSMGHPVFKPSELVNDMINGNVHILDEINLLPLSTLRFLQGILDNKKEIEYKGQIIKIADGFKIIGTMNLYVNGQAYALPEPLVDRAEKIKEIKSNAELIASVAF